MTGDDAKRTMVQRVGDWLAREKEEKDQDLAKLMKANIVLSFLTFMSVAGYESALSLWVMLGL
jgi:hypothetical protein